MDLKTNNKALWNGKHGGPLVRINEDKEVYAFSREKDGERVVVVLNLSSEKQKTNLSIGVEGYRDIFTNQPVNIMSGADIELDPWAYFVYSSK